MKFYINIKNMNQVENFRKNIKIKFKAMFGTSKALIPG